MISLAPEETWAVIPVFNEAETVGQVLARAHAAGLRCLVVDDGSSDRSSEAARRAGAEVVVRHPENQGYDVALASGLRAAAPPPGPRPGGGRGGGGKGAGGPRAARRLPRRAARDLHDAALPARVALRQRHRRRV